MALRPLLTLGLLAAASAATAQEAERKMRRMPVLTPAEIDNTLRIGGEDIAAAKKVSRMTVEVMVNGTGPHSFIVDSGADTSVIGERLAAELGLPAGRPAILNAMTEVKPVERVLVESLTLGPTTITALELPVLRDADIGAAGMIGLDALVERRLMLDFNERTISVDDARTHPPMLHGEIVVTARMQRDQLILTRVKANGINLDAVVDTGTEVTIGNARLREKLVRRRQKFEQIEVYGVTGKPALLDLAVVTELRLGPVILRNVPIAFAEVPPFEFFGISDTPALLLGTDLMETFRKVSLDFHARKVRFQLRSCTTQTTRVRTMGQTATRIGGDRLVTAVCER